MKIAFFHQGVPCHGLTPRLRPLGGTESAMIQMAEALALIGHEVTVFTEVDRKGLFAGVSYRPHQEFEYYASHQELDVFICIRQILPILLRRWAKVQIYFSPDAADQPFVNTALTLQMEIQGQLTQVGLFSLEKAYPYVDQIFCVGEWQAQTFMQKFHIPNYKITVAGNGVDFRDFQTNPPLASRKRQIVYASTPFRGLEYLLRYFPKIKARVPDATCAVLSGMQVYGQSSEEDQKNYGALYDLARQQEGIILHGPLSKPEMAKILCESRVMAYPNTFAETFCIAVLEGQAAGLPVVTSRLGALIERIDPGKDGFLIPGHPSLPTYENEFIERTCDLLQNDALWEKMNVCAYEKAKTYDYALLAKRWTEIFTTCLTRKAFDPAPHYPMMPNNEKLTVLMGGYPKEIELSQDFLKKYLAEAAIKSGFGPHYPAV